MRGAAVVTYIAVMVGVTVAVNDNAENGMTALLFWSASSLLLGWIARHPMAILLPLLAIPIAVPFGSAEKWLGSDAPSVVVGMLFQAPAQVVLVVLGFGGRLGYERIQRRGRGGTSR
jgi:hypothetical protein